MNKLKLSLAAVPSAIIVVAALAAVAVAATGGQLLFDGTFESPSASGAPSPWKGWQCANYGGQTGTKQYFGDAYFDTGGSTSISKPVHATFTQASSAKVPPLAGSDSVRVVLPITPAGAGWTRTYCGFLSPKTLSTAIDGTGKTAYYGLAIYVPVGMTLSYKGIDGVVVQELHTNFVSAAPISTQLHLGYSPNGTANNSVAIAIQSGACNPGGHSGCSYQSSPAQSTPCTGSGSSPPGPGGAGGGVPDCALQKTYAIPPGALHYGVWNEYVCGIDWETAPTGRIQCWYKYKQAGSTWTQSNAAPLSGIPTIQWALPAGAWPNTSAGCCPSSYLDPLNAYTGVLSKPFSINYDDEISGTTLSIAEAQLP